MIIRNVTREDDAFVQEMVYASLVRQFPRLYDLGVDQSVLDRLELFPSSKDQGCFVAEEDGKIYGIVCLTWDGKPSPLTQVGAQALMKEFGMRKGLEIWLGLRMCWLVIPISCPLSCRGGDSLGSRLAVGSAGVWTMCGNWVLQ